MVDDTEAEVRRLLAYCGLPFEEQCLRFFENARPVRTQVRSRCASRSIAKASITGATSSRGLHR